MNINTFIRHRVNTIQELSGLDTNLGTEIDLRNINNSIILNHEPFENGDIFEEYLKYYKHNTCILNTKSDGFEEQLIRQMNEHNNSNYFFLDTTVPSMVKYIKKGFKKLSVRFSEYEPLEFVKQFEGKVEWVWVDCFTKNTLTSQAYSYLKKNFKICVVSPELQSHPLEWIDDFKKGFSGFDIDAVCTKKPELWK